MKIRNEQIAGLDQAVEARRKQEFTDRLRLEYPGRASEWGNERLAKHVDEGYANARDLEIADYRSIYRFLALGMLPPETLNDPKIQSSMIRILNNLNMTGERRLDFIDRHVLRRMP